MMLSLGYSVISLSEVEFQVAKSIWSKGKKLSKKNRTEKKREKEKGGEGGRKHGQRKERCRKQTMRAEISH